jgi:hypothetical protein
MPDDMFVIQANGAGYCRDSRVKELLRRQVYLDVIASAPVYAEKSPNLPKKGGMAYSLHGVFCSAAYSRCDDRACVVKPVRQRERKSILDTVNNITSVVITTQIVSL